MTVQTFSFRAASRGLRQILCLSRSVTQSVWPRFYLESLGEGEKPFLYSVCRWFVVPVCCSFVVLVALLNVLISGREQKTCPSTSESSNWRCCETNSPSSRFSLFFFTPPHHSLMKSPRDKIWHERLMWQQKTKDFLPVKHTNTRCILTFKKWLANCLMS